MAEPDFAALRARLEADADQPPFETIRARRQRRTLRLAIAGTVAATLLVLVGGVAVIGGPRRSAPVPVGPPSTGPTVSPTGSAGPGPNNSHPDVVALTASPSGDLYAVTGRCDGNCTTSAMVFTLLHSTDLGATWATVTRLDWVSIGHGLPVLLAADDTRLWLGADSTVGVSSDGGQDWARHDLSAAPTGQLRGSVAGTTAWFGWTGQVLRAPAGAAPAVTKALPADVTGINVVTAISDTRAVVGRVW